MTHLGPIFFKYFYKDKITPLNEAAQKAPEEKGCYIMFLDDELVYVGKAENGLRNKLSHHYGDELGDATLQAEKNIKKYRNNINVFWKTLDSVTAVKETEKKWVEECFPTWIYKAK